MTREASGLRTLCLIVAVSGAAGLAHEVAWARALGQTLGLSLPSLTAVLVAFLGGLGLGALLASRRAGRTGSPLRDYAVLEIAIAIWGLAAPFIAGMVREGVVTLAATGHFREHQEALRFAIACVALTPLTLMMGATFPLVIREAGRRGADSGTAVRALYGWNTIGGAVGACVGSFLLLPLLGTKGAFMAAAGGNLLAAVAALLSWLRQRAAAASKVIATPAEAGITGTATSRRGGSAPLVVAALTATIAGGAAALLQIGWTRAITLSFGSSIYALGITLTSYILGIGLGPLVVPRRLLRPDRVVAVAAGAFWIVATSSLALLPLLGRMPVLAAFLSGRFETSLPLMFAAQSGAILLCLLLPTLAHGATFPCLALLGEGNGRVPTHRAAALVYTWSTWGSVAGLSAGGLLLIPSIGAERTLRVAACMALLLSFIFFLTRLAPGGSARPRPLRQALATALWLAPLVLLALPRWDRDVMTSGGFLYGPIYRSAMGQSGLPEVMRRRGEVLFERESAEALVTVRRSQAGVLSLQINGRTEASSGGDMATQLLAAHLPLLLHPGPEKVLVIGLASGITVGAVGSHAVRDIRVVEIVPAVVEAARLFSPHNGNALDDPRLEIVLDDARAHLLTSADRFDVITSQPSNPWIAGVANLYTVEFYDLIRSRLKPGGLFCQWVQAYHLDPIDLRAIVASFLRIFPDATLWEESAGSGDYFLIGGDGPLRIDPERLRSAPGALAELSAAGIRDEVDLLARFVTGPTGLFDFSAGTPPQTDDRLDLEWRAPLALFRRTLHLQVTEINRHRQPVGPFLSPASAVDPGLLARLSQRLREREARLQIVEGLDAADFETLTDPYMAAGLSALRAGLYPDAIALLNRATSKNPESGTAGLLLGEAYRAADLLDAAVVVFRRVVEVRPNLSPAWNALGRTLWSLDRAGEARDAFDEALRRDPGFAAARNNLGSILLASDDPVGARREFEAALVDDPFLAAARANLGLALKRLGDLAGAESAYRQALTLAPLNNDVRYNLAMLLRETGRDDSARREFARILEIDPVDAGARAALSPEDAPR
ncbi:MAG: fused MFS/spermidine synthase [Acidobacteria bacterium]|nr:fused MFS/spermidine synthase [Acidobacteriota bacterium]